MSLEKRPSFGDIIKEAGFDGLIVFNAQNLKSTVTRAVENAREIDERLDAVVAKLKNKDLEALVEPVISKILDLKARVGVLSQLKSFELAIIAKGTHNILFLDKISYDIARLMYKNKEYSALKTLFEDSKSLPDNAVKHFLPNKLNQ